MTKAKKENKVFKRKEIRLPVKRLDGSRLDWELRIFRRSFLDSSDAIMITDAEGKLIDVNPAFEHLYGYSRREVLGKTPRILRSESSSPELYKVMWRDILNPRKGFWKGEIINHCKDGRLVPVLLSITPIHNSGGEITHYMGLAIDMSEKRRLDEQVRRLRREYGAFLRHELRNMLAGIIGYLELAVNLEKPISPRQEKFLRSALNSTHATLNVINMLRELEHYEMGRIKLNLQEASLVQIVKNACTHVRPLAREGGIRIKLKRSIENDQVEVDSPKMESVIVNLLKNAVEHVAGIPEEAVVVCIYRERGRPAVSVNNRGKPIPPERLETFFERFNTTKKETGGTGLGTTFAELITRAHQGDVRVISTAEGGTTVTVVLPTFLETKAGQRKSGKERTIPIKSMQGKK